MLELFSPVTKSFYDWCNSFRYKFWHIKYSYFKGVSHMSDFEKDKLTEQELKEAANTEPESEEISDEEPVINETDPGAEANPEPQLNEEAVSEPKEDEQTGSESDPKVNEDAKSEPDILDDLEFISHESVRDKSKMAEGSEIRDEMLSKKKTKRRSVDAEAAKKEKVQKIARKNLHVIVIVVVVIIVLLVLLGWGLRQRAAKLEAQNLEQPVSSQEYETDAHEQINELIADYYACYAEGNVENILQYAYPMSDSEKSYIQMYSAYVENYENIVCYTKTGEDESAYIVSASFEVKFDGVDTTAPGMDFFYVRINDDGSAYIDNTYSPFNLLYQEYTLDQTIVQLIQTYEASEDVIALQAGVQTSYEQALEQDEALRTLVEGTLADAVSAWQTEYETAQQQKTEDATQQVEEETAAEEQAEAEAAAEAEAQADAAETTETENKAWVYVTDTVNIRQEPNESSAVLASATAGSQIRQLAVTSDGWTKVKTGEIVGYIKTEYISADAAAVSSTSLTEGSTIRLTASVNIRSSMSESSERIGLAYAGESVTVVTSYSEGWTKVTWNGQTGYIRTDVLAGM